MKYVFYIIKWLIELAFNFQTLIYHNKKNSKIILMLTPQYLNYGDHAIAVSERKFLKKKYPNRSILEINMSCYKYWSKAMKKKINFNDIIVITGGGYIGSLWPELQLVVEDVLDNFKNNKIIFAPQTIYFKDKDNSPEFNRFRNKLIEHGNVHFFARENNTYELLCKEMNLPPNIVVSLAPDMVLGIERNIAIVDKRNKVGICIRKDCEGILENRLWTQINCYIKDKGLETKEITMAKEHVEIPIWFSEIAVKFKLKEFSERKFVITDRLHGMIFAAITGTPCIALDNVSKKVSGVYEWIRELDYIFLINDYNQFEKAMNEIKKIDYKVCREQLKKLQLKLCERVEID